MVTACPICGASARQLIRLRNAFTARRCLGCTVVFADPTPSDAELSAYYSGWLFSLPEPSLLELWREHTRKGAKIILADLDKRGGPPVRRMLDYGGGLGFFTRAFADSVDEAALFDMSEASLDYARSAFGDRISIYGEAGAALASGPYDLIVVNQVIEHVPDPVAFMAAIRPALAAGGTLVVTTPNNAMMDAFFRRDVLGRYLRISAEGKPRTIAKFLADSWIGLDPPRHLFSFNQKSLAETMMRAGYVDAGITTWPQTGDPLGYPAYVNEKSDIRSRIQRFRRRTGAALTGLLDRKHRHGNTLGGFFHASADARPALS